MTRSKSILALIFIGLLSILLTPYAVAAGSSSYTVLVDDTLGFYKVYNLNNTPFTYDNQTLNITAGDTVIWKNDVWDNSELTILSKQNLWGNRSGYLRYTYDTFNYTFTVPGTYEIYVKEYPKDPHQTIVVAPIVIPTVTTPAPTPTVTATSAPTATVTQTPQEAPQGLSIWYFVLGFVVVAGIILGWYFFKKKPA
ncbi:Uncharacterised protein [uncultured archaeon]|nr:Uncharacterised protein [uncultured archaeon]